MNADHVIKLLESLKADLIHSMQAAGAGNTDQTAKSLAITATADSFQLQIPGYMKFLETGRGPTSANPVAGDPPMIGRIQQWCRTNGIPDKAAWAIKKSIDKKGYKGKPGILSIPLGAENINARLAPALKAIEDQVIQLALDAIG